MSSADVQAERRQTMFALVALGAPLLGPLIHTLLARSLGPAGYGRYSWNVALIEAVAMVGMLGTEVALRSAVAEAHGSGAPQRLPSIVGPTLRVVALWGCALALAQALLAPLIGHWQRDPGLVPFVRGLALVPVVANVVTVLIATSQATGAVLPGAVIRGLLLPTSTALLLTMALLVRQPPFATITALVVAHAITLAAALFSFQRTVGLRPTLVASLRVPLEWGMIRHAATLLGATLFWMVSAKVDIFVLARYVPAKSVGVYAVGLFLAGSIGAVRGAFDPLVCAVIPAALARNDVAGLEATLRRQTRWLALLASPIVIVLLGAGASALRVVFGPLGPSGTTSLMVLTCGQFIGGIAVSSWIVPLSGRPRWVLLTAASTVAVKVALLVALVPRWGILGAAIATAAGTIIAQHGQALGGRVLTGIRAFDGVLVSIAGVILLGALAARAVQGHLMGSTPPLVCFAVASFVGIAVATAVASVAVFDADDRAQLRALAARFLPRRS